jgi:hypothetical protein
MVLAKAIFKFFLMLKNGRFPSKPIGYFLGIGLRYFARLPDGMKLMPEEPIVGFTRLIYP